MKKEFEKRILSSVIMIPIVLFFIVKGSLYFTFFLCIFFSISAYEWFKMSKNDIIKFFGIIYLITILYLAYLLRKIFGVNIFIFVIFICILTDIGGYVFGNFFKGPKLTKISPNKTYAGMIGSFILPILTGYIYINFQDFLKVFDISNLQKEKLIFFLIIFFISATSQIGDLIISYFKRLAKIKNTGKILPGHGGLLDRVDGIIFAIPVSFLLFSYFNL